MQNRCLGCIAVALPGGPGVWLVPQSLCLEDVLTPEVDESFTSELMLTDSVQY